MFVASLGYTVRSRPAWAPVVRLSQENKKKDVFNKKEKEKKEKREGEGEKEGGREVKSIHKLSEISKPPSVKRQLGPQQCSLPK